MSKYDKSFKEEAVRLALTSSQPTSQTARDLGISEGNLYNWISRAKATSIFDYIEVFYNRKRKHSYLGYKSPEQYELSCGF